MADIKLDLDVDVDLKLGKVDDKQLNKILAARLQEVQADTSKIETDLQLKDIPKLPSQDTKGREQLVKAIRGLRLQQAALLEASRLRDTATEGDVELTPSQQRKDLRGRYREDISPFQSALKRYSPKAAEQFAEEFEALDKKLGELTTPAQRKTADDLGRKYQALITQLQGLATIVDPLSSPKSKFGKATQAKVDRVVDETTDPRVVKELLSDSKVAAALKERQANLQNYVDQVKKLDTDLRLAAVKNPDTQPIVNQSTAAALGSGNEQLKRLKQASDSNALDKRIAALQKEQDSDRFERERITGRDDFFNRYARGQIRPEREATITPGQAEGLRSQADERLARIDRAINRLDPTGDRGVRERLEARAAQVQSFKGGLAEQQKFAALAPDKQLEEVKDELRKLRFALEDEKKDRLSELKRDKERVKADNAQSLAELREDERIRQQAIPPADVRSRLAENARAEKVAKSESQLTPEQLKVKARSAREKEVAKQQIDALERQGAALGRGLFEGVYGQGTVKVSPETRLTDADREDLKARAEARDRKIRSSRAAVSDPSSAAFNPQLAARLQQLESTLADFKTSLKANAKEQNQSDLARDQKSEKVRRAENKEQEKQQLDNFQRLRRDQVLSRVADPETAVFRRGTKDDGLTSSDIRELKTATRDLAKSYTSNALQFDENNPRAVESRRIADRLEDFSKSLDNELKLRGQPADQQQDALDREAAKRDKSTREQQADERVKQLVAANPNDRSRTLQSFGSEKQITELVAASKRAIDRLEDEISRGGDEPELRRQQSALETAAFQLKQAASALKDVGDKPKTETAAERQALGRRVRAEEAVRQIEQVDYAGLGDKESAAKVLQGRRTDIERELTDLAARRTRLPDEFETDELESELRMNASAQERSRLELQRLNTALQALRRQLNEDRAQDREVRAASSPETRRLEQERRQAEEEARRVSALQGADYQDAERLVDRGENNAFRNVSTYEQGTRARQVLQDRRADVGQRLTQRRLEGGSTRDLQREMEQTERAMGQLESRMARFSSQANEASLILRQFLRYAVGYQALYGLGAAIGGTTRSLVDLDTELHAIEAIAGASADQLLEIEAAIKKVGVTTKFTNSEIAQAARILSQAGVEPAKVREVLTATATFAAATGSAIQDSADLVSTFTKAFKELDSVQIADKLTTAINISKLSAEDLKPILSISAQIANSYNLTADQYLAAVTALRNAGLKASTTATGLRQALVGVFSPSNKTVQQLRQRYIEIGEFFNEDEIVTRFQEYKNGDNPLRDVLDELNRLGFNDEGERSIGSRSFNIRGENAIRALLQQIDGLAEAEAKLAVSGSALLGSDIQLRSLSATIDNLGAVMTVLSDSVTDGAIPSIQQLLHSFTQLLKKTTEFNDELKETTSIGLGSIALGATGVGAAVFSGSRGTVLQRARRGAVAGGATALGLSQGGPIISAAEQAGIDPYSVANGALTAGLLTKALTDALRAPLSSIADRFTAARYRVGAAQANTNFVGPGPREAARSASPTARIGGGVRAAIPVAAAGSSAASTATQAAAGATIAATVRDFFSANAWTRLKTIFTGAANAIKGFVTKNPIGLFVTGVLGIGAYFLSQRGEDERNLKKLQQSRENFRVRAAKYQDARQNLRQLEVGTGGADGAPGSLRGFLDTAERQIEDYEAELADFFGELTDERLNELEGFFETLQLVPTDRSSGRQAVLRSLANSKILDDQLSAEIRDLASAEGLLTDRQVVLTRGIADLANRYSRSNDKMLGVRDKIFEQFNQITNQVDKLGSSDSLPLTQKALFDAVADLNADQFNLLAGDIDGTVGQVRDLIAGIQDAIVSGAQKVEESERNLLQQQFNTQVDNLVQAYDSEEDGVYDQGQTKATLRALINDAKSVGLDFAELLGLVDGKIDEQIGEIGELRRYSNALGFIPREDRIARRDNLEGLRTSLQDSISGAQRDRVNVLRSKESEVVGQIQDGLSYIAPGTTGGEKFSQLSENNPQVKAMGEIRELLKQYLERGGFDKEDLLFVNEAGQPTAQAERVIKIGEQFRPSETYDAAKDAELAKLARARRNQRAAAEENARITQEATELEIEAIEASRERLGDDEEVFKKQQANQRAAAQAGIDKAQRELDTVLALEDNLEQLRALPAVEANLISAKSEMANLLINQAFETEEYNRILAEERLQRELIINQLKRDLEARGPAADVITENRENATQGADLGYGGFIGTEYVQRGEELNRRDRYGIEPGKDERLSILETDRSIQEQEVDDAVTEYDAIKNREVSGDKEQETRDEELLAKEKEINDLNTALGVTNDEITQLTQNPWNELSEAMSFDSLAENIETMAPKFEDLGETINSIAAGSMLKLGTAFNDALQNGENFGDAMRSVFTDMAAQIADLAIQLMIMMAFKAIAGGAGAKTGTADVAELRTGTSNVADVPGQKPLKFNTGGYIKGPGTGTSDSIPGVILDGKGRVTKGIRVSHGEAILNAKATQALGRETINRINSGDIVKMATGGVVEAGSMAVAQSEPSNSASAAMMSSGTQSKPAASDGEGINIVNMVDKEMFEDYLGSHNGGRTLVNEIRHNAQAIRSVLG